MRIKKITAPDMPTALSLIRESLGPDAVIISEEHNAKGELELTIALEEAEEISFDHYR